MELLIRRGGPEDTKTFLDLVEAVREGMDHKEWFYLDSPEDVTDWMNSGKMKLWLAEDGDKTAAVFTTTTPGRDPSNYGYDLDFSEDMLDMVVNMDTAAVNPEYRGHGLQNRMLLLAEEEAAKDGPKILLCTVHPDNQYSLNNVIKHGYQIQHRTEKYGSVRYILRKDV